VSNEVEELFSEGTQAVRPKVGRVFALILIGLAIALLGFPCSAVPGGVVVMFGWYFAEKEYARLQAGFFANDLRPTIVGARGVAIGGVVATSLLFATQLYLTSYGYYEGWWRSAVVALGWLLWGPLEA